MAHFAEIGNNNIVTRVIVIDNKELLDNTGVEREFLGQTFCYNLLGGTWIQTSYNGNFRKNYAGVGYTYDSQRDAFIPPQPYPSWQLDDNTCQWYPPIPHPSDGKIYAWDELSQSWQEIS